MSVKQFEKCGDELEGGELEGGEKEGGEKQGGEKQGELMARLGRNGSANWLK